MAYQYTDLAGDFLHSFKYQAEYQHKLHLAYSVADELQLLRFDAETMMDMFEGLNYTSLNMFGNDDVPQIILHFSMSWYKEAGGHVARVARMLLPSVHTFTKEFNETNNYLSLRARYKGVDIVLESTPPSTCTVETIEEEVEVPEQVIPAKKEKRVRYVMKGDCDPLLAQPIAVVTQPPPSDLEIPF